MANRSDNFNRANSADLGTPSDGGSAWNEHGFDWSISGNRARCAGGLHAIATLDTGAADGLVEVLVPLGYSNVRLVARCTDADNYFMAAINLGAGTLDIYKKEGGSFSTLATTSLTQVGPVTFGLRCVGSSIKFYNGGVEVTAVACTSSFNLTATRWGIGAFVAADEFDDFVFTDLGAPSSSVAPPAMSHYRRRRV